MNEVTIFTDITTEHALLAIEEDAKTYTGLYVDMNEAKGRKFVKESAANIGDILKRLDRARIDKAKDFKAQVEKEAEAIRFRLEEANKPFTLLIDEYNAERKKVLDAENARKKAIEDQAAIDSDYEIAELLMGKHFDDKAKAEQQRIAYEENLKREAAEQAVVDAKLLAEQVAAKAIQDKQDAINEASRLEAARIAQEAKYKQDAIDAENRRLADIEATKQAEIFRQQKAIEDDLAEKARLAANHEHVAQVHRDIKAVYIAAGFPDELAIKAVQLLVKNKLPNTAFNY